MKGLYINGKQANIWQRVLFAMAGIGILIFLIPLGFVILAAGLVIALSFYVYIYFKLRQVKKVMEAQQADMFKQASEHSNKARSNVIDGEFKEL